MARPRTARPPEKTDRVADAHINEGALVEAGEAASLHSQQLALVEKEYAIDMPYDYERFIARGRELVIETSMRLVELGLVLIHIREHEPHGKFLPALDRIGVAPRFAQRAMQAAVKMRDRPRIAELGVTKALELVSEDDETLDALEKGGTLAGLTMDEIDAMSTRELKAALRAERAEREEEKTADEDIIRTKDERINKLMRDRRKGAKTSAEQQAEEMLRDLDAHAVDAVAALTSMRKLADEIEGLFNEAGESVPPAVIERIDQNREFAAKWLRTVAGDLGE